MWYKANKNAFKMSMEMNKLKNWLFESSNKMHKLLESLQRIKEREHKYSIFQKANMAIKKLKITREYYIPANMK